METRDLMYPSGFVMCLYPLPFIMLYPVSTHGSAKDIISIWIVYTWALQNQNIYNAHGLGLWNRWKDGHVAFRYCSRSNFSISVLNSCNHFISSWSWIKNREFFLASSLLPTLFWPAYNFLWNHTISSLTCNPAVFIGIKELLYVSVPQS